jgi:hypothetical protein
MCAIEKVEESKEIGALAFCAFTLQFFFGNHRDLRM